jgi:Fuc2NAc and GlcNAc transferase
VPALGLTWLDTWPAARFVIVVVGLVWLLNLYNFMDGIDGLAASEAVCVALGLAGAAILAGYRGEALWFALLLAGSSLGFLYWNWSPARIFMGDVGSGFLGFALGALSLDTMRGAGLPVHVPLILFAVFVTDATVTLVRRVLQGARWHEAHRSHAYQRLARRYGSHRPVVVGVLLVNLGWLLPLSFSVVRWPGFADVFLVVAYVPIAVMVAVTKAGRQESAVHD